MRIGARYAIGTGSGGEEFFNGKIDEVRFYKRALSANEISLLSNGAGAIADLNGNSLDDEAPLAAVRRAILS